jgi:hypothetical protein
MNGKVAYLVVPEERNQRMRRYVCAHIRCESISRCQSQDICCDECGQVVGEWGLSSTVCVCTGGRVEQTHGTARPVRGTLCS